MDLQGVKGSGGSISVLLLLFAPGTDRLGERVAIQSTHRRSAYIWVILRLRLHPAEVRWTERLQDGSCSSIRSYLSTESTTKDREQSEQAEGALCSPRPELRPETKTKGGTYRSWEIACECSFSRRGGRSTSSCRHLQISPAVMSTTLSTLSTFFSPPHQVLVRHFYVSETQRLRTSR